MLVPVNQQGLFQRIELNSELEREIAACLQNYLLSNHT